MIIAYFHLLVIRKSPVHMYNFMIIIVMKTSVRQFAASQLASYIAIVHSDIE